MPAACAILEGWILREPWMFIIVPASALSLMAAIRIIKSFRCRYQWMPRDASSEPDTGPLPLRGSWGLLGLLAF